jgi:mitogen-activated protein kinase organizer 1
MYSEVRTLKGHAGPVATARFNQDGQYCLTAGYDRTVCLWNPFRDAAEGEHTGGLLLKQYDAGARDISSLAVASDSSKFVSAGGDRAATVWDVASGAVIRKCFGHDQRVNVVALNEEASILCSGSADKTVRLFDLRSASRTAVQVLRDARDGITGLESRGERIFASSLDGAVRIYDLRQATCAADEIGHPVASFALAHDGRSYVAAVTAQGGALVLVDESMHTVLNRYSGHANKEYPLTPCYSADDAHVMCGSEDGRVVIWDLVDASTVAEWAAHKRAVACVQAHGSTSVPSSRTSILTASFDGTAKLWAQSTTTGSKSVLPVKS